MPANSWKGGLARTTPGGTQGKQVSVLCSRGLASWGHRDRALVVSLRSFLPSWSFRDASGLGSLGLCRSRWLRFAATSKTLGQAMAEVPQQFRQSRQGRRSAMVLCLASWLCEVRKSSA